MTARPAGSGRLSRFKRFLGWPLVLVIFWFWWRSLQRLGVDWTGVLARAGGHEVDLLLALLGAAAYVILQAVTWREIVAGLVFRLSRLTSLRLWTITNFARYLPGSMWHLVGRVYLGKDAGVNRTTGALSVLLEQGLQLLAAILLFVLTLPFWPGGTVATHFAWLIAVVPLGLIAIHPRLFFPLLNAGLRLVGREPVPAPLRYRDLLGYLALYLVTHAANALALVFAVRALGGAWQTMPAVVGAGMLAWTIGVISLLTPGGLGLREGLVTLVLSPLVGVDVAAMGAVLWRAANILTEALCAVLFSAVRWLIEPARTPEAVGHVPEVGGGNQVQSSIPTPDTRRPAAGARTVVARRPRAAWLADVAAAALILALVALFFWRLWAPNPADRVAFPIGDFTNQYYPLRRFVAAALASGHLPFWNPSIFGGQPGLADPQAAALYPPALLNALLWGPRFPLIALELEAVAHIALAALGMYAFIRGALELGVLPAVTGALVFAFGGYLTGFPIEQVTILESAAWLPWLLLAIHRAANPARPQRYRASRSAAGALLLGLAVLAGHPQTALYLSYVTLAYALFRLGRPRRGGWRAWLRVALPLAAIFPLGAGLAAAQWLPTQAFIAESSRSSLDYAFARTGLGWDELLTLFVPQLVGSNPLYGGIGALVLVLIAGLTGLGRQQRFWLLAALASLLLALGGNSFFFDLVYLSVPGFAHVRSQERVLLLFALALALFAAWGMVTLDQLPDEPTLRERLKRAVGGAERWLPLLLAPLLAFWWLRALLIAGYRGDAGVFDAFYEGYVFFVIMLLANWGLLRWLAAGGPREEQPAREEFSPVLPSRRRSLIPAGRRGAPLLLVGLLLFDLFSVNRAAHIGPPATEVLRPPQPLLDALQTALAATPARVAVVGAPPINGNDGMRWGLPLLTGNEPLRLSNTKDFLLKVEPWRQFQLLHVGYVVADRDLAAEAPALYERLAGDEGAFLVRLREPAPYAWLVGQTEILAAGRSEIRERLNDPRFDPMAVALFDEPEPAAERPVKGAVTVDARAPGFIRLHTSVPAAAILVVAEPFTKGWRATIDGQPAKVRRANILNTALPLAPGEHIVTLHYEQAGWRQGLAISGASLGVVLLVLAWGLSGRRFP
ncbi:MAG: lysylphosphatidylglycerol synthase domain-containing protein [Ardenticatenaceae bacterium]|nr:lysylphosphatidylglycerol synthase domain-containing protein [Ardenticatenaceae bacterium]